MKKILGLAIAAFMVMTLVGAGTWAYFSDTETSTGNILSAGTLDLDINSGDSDYTTLVTNITDVVPGSSATDTALLAVSGTVAGELDITIGTVDSDDNGLIVDAETVGGSDATDGTGNGELDANLWATFWLDYNNSGSWDNVLDTGLGSDGSTYNYSATPLLSATATGGTLTTVVDSGASWVSDAYQGYLVTVTGLGTGVVTGNTATTITVATEFSSTPTNQAITVADGPHYDLISAYSGNTYDAVLSSMLLPHDFTIEWVVPVSVGNVIMSDDVYFDVTFVLEQPSAD